MQPIKRRESVYTNQRGTSATRPQPIGSREGVGNTSTHTQSLREKQKNAARSGDDHASANPRQRGGQASLGLFGIAGAGRARVADARRQQGKAPAEVPAQGQAPQADDQPSRVGGLTFSQRRSVILSRTDVAAVSLRTYERRAVPAGPSMESLIAAARARTAAQDEEAAAPKATAAMLRAAHAADMREAFPHFHDDEQADFARRCAGAGFVEATLAMEGN